MINNKIKLDYCVHKWRYADYKKFKTVGDIKVGLAELINLSDELELVVGYIEPGHGAKGRQRWLNDDGDLVDLYQL